MARMTGVKGYDGEGGFSGVEGKFGRDPLLYQGNITGRGFNGETMRGARPRDWQTDPSDMDWNAFGNPMQDRMAPDLSGENPNYMQDSLKYIGDERYDEEDPAQIAAWYKGLADKGIGMPENRDPFRPHSRAAMPEDGLAEGLGEPGRFAPEDMADSSRRYFPEDNGLHLYDPEQNQQMLARGDGPIPYDKYEEMERRDERDPRFMANRFERMARREE